MINHSPHPHLLPYTLTISLSRGTGYERHPLEVNLGKVVSGLLRSVDVLFAKLTDNTLFPGTQEIRELVQLSEILQKSFVHHIARRLSWARLVKELSSANH